MTFTKIRKITCSIGNITDLYILNHFNKSLVKKLAFFHNVAEALV